MPTQEFERPYIDGRLAIKEADKQRDVMSFVNRLIDALPFELHLPGYKYAGPGTRLQKRLARGDKPRNALDLAARNHDIAYARDKDHEKRREADLVLSKEAGKRFWAPDSSLGEKAAAALVKAAMVVKRKVGGRVRRKVGGRVRRKVGGGRRRKRALPLARRRGGTLRRGRGRRPHGGWVAPLAAALSAGLTGIKTVKDMRNARRALAEQARHNRTLERIAAQRGLRVGAGRRRPCARQRVRFL